MKIQKASQNSKRNFMFIMADLVLGGLLGTSSLGLGAQDVWTQKADMPTGRLWHASSVVDGKIYAIGGASNRDVDD